MKKELIIIVIKDYYTIKELFLPTQGITDVKIIYPVSNNYNEDSVELDEIYKQIYKHIDEQPDSSTSRELKQIVRLVKLKNITKNDD